MSVLNALLVLGAAAVAWRFAVLCLRARADFVDPKVAARLRGLADTAAELEVALGTPQAKRPELREQGEPSAPKAFSREWPRGNR